METTKIDQAAELLKLMAHPDRIRIILLLAQRKSMSVTALQQQLPTEKAYISQHLTKMKDRGLVIRGQKGRGNHYSLADSAFSQAVRLLLERSDNPNAESL